MAYQKQTWQNGDVITAEKLNHMEDGIADSASEWGDITGDISEQTDLAEALAAKADTDGSYESMSVGTAEQLASSVGINDRVPYLFRTSGGSADIGNRLTDKIVGGTIAWNQIVTVGSDQTKTENGFTITYDHSTGQLTVVASNPSGATYMGIAWRDLSAGHKYVISNVGMRKGQGLELYYPTFTSNPTNNDSYIANVNSSGTGIGLRIYCSAGTASGTYKSYPMVFDLTQMFGSTIADYIYSLEQATAGAGVAWFRKLFPKPYYPYNAGELLSVSGLQSHDMVGFNQIAEVEFGNIDATGADSGTSHNYIRTKGYITALHQEYCFSLNNNTNSAQMYLLTYDSNKNLISRTQIASGVTSEKAIRTFTPDANVAYIRAFVYGKTAYNSLTDVNICINLSWDGERNGEYEAYKKWSYPLDSSLTLRGVPKLDANDDLYYDGDTYESDGTVTRRFGVVDLGTLTYTYNESSLIGVPCFHATIPSIKVASNNNLCSKFVNKPNRFKIDGSGQMAIGNTIDANYIVFRDDSYTDATSFKSAMNGVYLVYELATPTTETATPYTNPQAVDDFGTEEYVTDSIVPVGHETFYQANLKAKLEMAPNSPDGDGDYVVRQSNGQNSYVPLAQVKELPNLPSTDGTYVLKATVSGGTATLSWVSE